MNSIRVETVIVAAPRAVYTCWTYANMISHWLCNRAMINARGGSAYTLIWNDGHWVSGTITNADPDKKLSFSWMEANSPGKTDIEITVTPEANGTRLILEQQGFGNIGAWESYRDKSAERWVEMLENLKILLETANDARHLRQPTLGLSLETLSAERRANIGLQVSYGVSLTGVQTDGPAERAGMQPGDTLLTLNGVEISDFPDIHRANTGKKAGETVQAVLYRGGTTRTVDLTYGAHTPSAYPETRSALETVVSERVAAAERELDEIFAGVPEHLLAAKPAPNEWSANEVLAHLIWTERWTQQALWLMHTAGIDPVWGFNNEFEIAGIIAVQAESKALLAELKRVLNEQLLMIDKISDEVVSVKPLFALMSGWLSFIGDHLREHYDQIREAIAHSRETLPN